MQDAREYLQEGVLSHLQMLEMEALKLSSQQQAALEEQTRVEELRLTVEKLRAQRDQLRAKINTTMSVQQLKAMVDHRNEEGGDDGDEEGCSQNSELQLALLMARRTQLKDLLLAHHLIGGYDITATRKGKGACVSIATAFEGRYLETYSLEIDVNPRAVRICRHDVPPFIPLEKLAQESLQTDLRAFLHGLSQHLNAFVSRRQQVRLIQELLRDSVEVMESNALFNVVVLMCTEAGQADKAVLCTLEYADLTRYLPTKVTVESEDTALPASPPWRESQSLLLETPAHTALLTLKKKGLIA
ncbi:centromere protein O [Megalops cyprinoides]|uniref:centromere protein O n=1 Tax=Megalops cyprinoides TaxID=118141 RepID=UPI001863ED4A|nr:centromere protein O [Megalops cyprinoides]XP_036399011.1 centromere protein O [Megalops cyprinoides]